MSSLNVAKTLLLFLAGGLCEIAGGYLIWVWLRQGRPLGWGLTGAVLLVLFGVLLALLPSNFGRAYASYGGVFVVLSILWGWQVDGVGPDRYDLIGGAIVLAGVAVMMFWPRP